MNDKAASGADRLAHRVWLGNSSLPKLECALEGHHQIRCREHAHDFVPSITGRHEILRVMISNTAELIFVVGVTVVSFRAITSAATRAFG